MRYIYFDVLSTSHVRFCVAFCCVFTGLSLCLSELGAFNFNLL